MIDPNAPRLSRIEFERRIGSMAQAGGITEFTYSGGRANGVRAVRLDTGRLCAEIVVDRGLDLAYAAYGGVPFMWRSQNEITAPAFYDDCGDEWLRSFFGGWLTTCGLANFGPAGQDRFGKFGLHGRINNTPADTFTTSTRWIDDRCILEVSGKLHESKALTSDLTMERHWRTELGSSTLYLEDRVTNVGSVRTPHMILYHCNAGFPLVDRSTQLHVSHAAIEPRDTQAQAGMNVWDRGGEPQPGFAEQVFIHTPLPCTDGLARAAVVNPQWNDGHGLGFEIAYDPVALPALFTWRNLDYHNYVLSVEPANTPAIQGRAYADKHDVLPFLEAGEERVYRLAFTALSGDAIRAVIAVIASAHATAAQTR